MKNKINFLNFDIYAKRASFFYNDQERIGSYFGLFLSILYVLFSLILFIYYLIDTLNRKELKVYDSTLYAQEMPFINLDRNYFYFAFGLEDPVTLNRFVDETIYTAEVVFVDRVKINGEFVTIAKDILPISKCQDENFGKNYKHLFTEDELANSYCLKDFDYNLTFAGGFKYEKMTYIRIKIFPCKNSTENNNHCKPQEILDKYLTATYFSILLKDIGLNPSNYSYPTIPTLQDLYTTVDRRFYRNYILNFGLAEIHTDTGILNDNIKKDKYIQFRKEVQTFSFRDESEYLEGKELCLVQIRLDDTVLVQKRAYTKISEILSRIGGYMQLMNTIFLLVSLLLNKIDTELKIINSIFNFNLKKNKMILKFPNLQSLNTLIIPKSNKDIIVSKNKSIKSTKTFEYENNKSNYNLIIKSNNGASSLNNSKNKNKIILKKPSYKINVNKKDYINSFEKQINKSNFSSINIEKSMDNDVQFYNENNQRIILPLNDKRRNSSFREYSQYIKLNLFDYLCPGKDVNKRRMIGLFNLGTAFYRKRMDIVLVFSHLLLTEKILTTKNSYLLCKEIELLYPKN
jgi:hypothetical protein